MRRRADGIVGKHAVGLPGRIRGLGPGAVTRVTGGFFSAHALRGNPLFEALPPLIHLRGGDPHVQRWLRPTLAFIDAEIATDEQGSRTVLRRLADVLFIQAVRVFIAQQDDRARGWLRGLTDPRIAQALRLFHERYAEPWTLDRLAHAVGMSRTALAVQFKALVGESPMAYLLRWRITRAAFRIGATHAGVTSAEVPSTHIRRGHCRRTALRMNPFESPVATAKPAATSSTYATAPTMRPSAGST